MIYKDRQCEICGERYHHSIGKEVPSREDDSVLFSVCCDCYRRAAEYSIREIMDFMKPEVMKGSTMAKSKGQAKVKKVMEEFKHGELHSGSKKGPEVKSRKQAVAIAMSESGQSKKKKKKKK